MILRLFAVSLSSFLLATFAGAEPLKVGADAPTPKAPASTGETVDFADVYAEGPTLIFFYPKADTPGCTKQACNVRDNFAELRAAGVQVLGVSKDDVEDQAAFKSAYSLPFTLIADSEGVVGDAFGVGRIPVVGMYNRQSFLVKDGKIAWRDLKAAPNTQSQDVLAALDE